jgi:hypothetical protein
LSVIEEYRKCIANFFRKEHTGCVSDEKRIVGIWRILVRNGSCNITTPRKIE